MSRSLTSVDYWESYYQKADPDFKKVTAICSVYDRYWNLLIEKNQLPEAKTIIEIGGYPGRYLAYLAAKYDLVPTSLDFNSDAVAVSRVMETFQVKDYHQIQADFRVHKPSQQYDVVISNGFIEHFHDYESILDKHVEYLADGGTMLVMIPNKRWLRRIYGWMVDYKNLKAHNLSCMHLSTFRRFATRHDLEILHLDYFGGFAYASHQKLNPVQLFIYKVFRTVFKRMNPFIASHPNKFFSSTIIACYRKPNVRTPV